MSATQRIQITEEEGVASFPPDPPEMISIPLRPREIYVPRSAVWKRRMEILWARLKRLLSAFPKIQLPEFDRDRSRDGFRSLAVALACNLVLLAVFCLVTISPPAGNEEMLFSLSPEPSTTPASNSASNEKDSDAEDKPTIPSQAAPSPPAVNVISATSLSSLQLETSFDSTSIGAGFDPTVTDMDFGMSISKDSFEAAETAWMNPQRGRGSAGGSGGSRSGVSIGELTALFAGNGQSDGSNMVLFTDQSGSMQAISNQVRSYVRARFKRARTVNIEGCAMRSHHCQFVKSLREHAAQQERTEYYFVCDLYDGTKPEAMESMRRSLIASGALRRLHIISFGKRPHHILQDLLDETGGSIQMIDKD